MEVRAIKWGMQSCLFFRFGHRMERRSVIVSNFVGCCFYQLIFFGGLFQLAYNTN